MVIEQSYPSGKAEPCLTSGGGAGFYGAKNLYGDKTLEKFQADGDGDFSYLARWFELAGSCVD